MRFDPVSDVVCTLGESPVWDDRRDVLFYVDLVGQAVHAFDPARGDVDRHVFESEACSIGLCESGRLVVALRREVILYDPQTRMRTPLARPELGPAHTRLNDGKVGPDGAFWVGSMDERPEREEIGILFRVTADGRAEASEVRAKVSNGLAWSPDGRTLFHSDSRGPWLDAWDFDPASGALSNRRRLAELDEARGRPDGAAVDADGYYWSAGVSAAVLNRFAPDGRLVETCPVPVASPTMPCFGGPDLTTLYLTSHREAPPERVAQSPLTGRLLAAKAPVAGTPVHRFKDI
jgi:sugar lactone lactonase YvrE